MLNILYDSDNFCVAEFAGAAGIELVDKQARRAVYLEGEVAAKFRRSFRDLAAAGSEEEELDEFLGLYGELPAHSLLLH